MSDRAETLVLRHSLTRREFTLEAALAILAGCIITVSDSACGSSTSPTPTAAPTQRGAFRFREAISAELFSESAPMFQRIHMSERLAGLRDPRLRRA